MVLGGSEALFLAVSEARGDVSQKENRKDGEKGLKACGQTDEAGDEESGYGSRESDRTHPPSCKCKSERQGQYGKGSWDENRQGERVAPRVGCKPAACDRQGFHQEV